MTLSVKEIFKFSKLPLSVKEISPYWSYSYKLKSKTKQPKNQTKDPPFALKRTDRGI